MAQIFQSNPWWNFLLSTDDDDDVAVRLQQFARLFPESTLKNYKLGFWTSSPNCFRRLLPQLLCVCAQTLGLEQWKCVFVCMHASFCVCVYVHACVCLCACVCVCKSKSKMQMGIWEGGQHTQLLHWAVLYFLKPLSVPHTHTHTHTPVRLVTVCFVHSEYFSWVKLKWFRGRK